MDTAMQWLQANWVSIVLVVGVICGILNRITQHYGEGHPRLKKALLFALDLLSPVVSAGSPGALKVPGTSSPQVSGGQS